MRTLVIRALQIPHNGSLYVDNWPGQPAVLWLKVSEFSEAEAGRIDRELNGPGQQAPDADGS